MEVRRALPEINVTPLIDVLLVLLIIFMVVTPLRPARFKALVPEEPTRRGDVAPNITTLVVSLDRRGGLRLNGGEPLGTAREMSRLAETLTDLFRRRGEATTVGGSGLGFSALPRAGMVEKTVFVKAPRSLPYGEVARVIDGIKGAGAHPIGLQIDDLEP